MNIYFIFPIFRISISGSNKTGLVNAEGFSRSNLFESWTVFLMYIPPSLPSLDRYFLKAALLHLSPQLVKWTTPPLFLWSDLTQILKLTNVASSFFPSLIQWLFMTISERIQRWKVFFEHESFYKTFSDFSFHLINSSSDLNEENEKETKDKSDMRRSQFKFFWKTPNFLINTLFIDIVYLYQNLNLTKILIEWILMKI